MDTMLRRERDAQGLSRRPSAAPVRSLRRVLVALVLIAAVVGTAGIVSAQAEPPAEVTIDQLHLFLIPMGDRLRISEYYLLGNSGDAVYEGTPAGDGDRITMLFPLPEGAVNVDLGEHAEYLRLTEDGIADTRPISPGVATTEVRFGYELPLTPGSPISRALPLPVAAAVLLISGEQWQLEGTALVALGPMEAGGQMARAYTFEPLSPARELTFSVVPGGALEVASGVGEASALTNATGLQVGLGALAAAGAIAISIAVWRSGHLPAPPASVRGDLQALAALDERFAAGEITAADYERAREALKRQIARSLRGAETPEWDMS